MSRARTLFPRHRAQRLPIRGTHDRSTIPRSRLSWHQWLSLWRAARRRESLQKLGDLWDAQHEQVWTQAAYSYRDFVIRERGPALRLAIYQHMALS
jgi:hypothetical protein